MKFAIVFLAAGVAALGTLFVVSAQSDLFHTSSLAERATRASGLVLTVPLTNSIVHYFAAVEESITKIVPKTTVLSWLDVRDWLDVLNADRISDVQGLIDIAQLYKAIKPLVGDLNATSELLGLLVSGSNDTTHAKILRVCTVPNTPPRRADGSTILP